MNKVRKSLGLVLAIALILNLFSLTAFATVKDGYLMSQRLTPVGSTNVSAGDTVRLEISIEAVPDFPTWNGGEYDIGYDSAIFSPAKALGDFSNGILTGYAYDGRVNTANSLFKPADSTPTADEVANYNWDSLMHIGMALDDQSYINVTTETKILAFEMKVSDSAPDGTYTIGIGKQGFDDMACYVNEESINGAYHGFGMGTTYGLANDDDPLYDVSESYVTFTVGASGPSVATGDVKAQWADKAAGKMNLGFTGTISGANLTLAGAEVTEGLYEIGMVFSATDDTPTIEEGATKVNAYTLYVSGSDYLFRAVMKNVPYDSADNFYVNTFIITADGADPIYGEPLAATNGAAQYTAAVARGLASFA